MTGLQGPSSGFAVPRSADAARLAGVSRKTVFRVFNDEPYVSAEVRQRVLEAAEALDHRLNNAAWAPASGRTRTAGYGGASLLVAIERAVQGAGYGAGRELAGGSDVTVVVAAGDEMTIRLIRALLEAGRSVPEDVSVVGFDDMLVADCVPPPSTTGCQSFDAAAREGLKLLLHAIDKPHPDLPAAADPRSSSSSARRPHLRRSGPAGDRRQCSSACSRRGLRGVI